MTAEFDNHHGELDESAGQCMEQIMEICRGAGSEWGPGEVMSAAIRLYHCVLSGGMICTPSAELQQMVEEQGDTVPSLKMH